MPGQRRIDELAAATGGRVIGDPSMLINGIASIEDAGEGDITFVSDKRHMKLIGSCRASALILSETEAPPKDGSQGFTLLLVKNPMLAAARILELFSPVEPPPPGIHPRAEVHPDAKLGAQVSIGALTIVEKGASIGERTVLMPGVYVGSRAEIGADSIIYSGVVIRERCKIGARAIIHCNAVIGSDGFGFTPDGSRSYKIPQNGIVRIEDDVEIGACTTIDRATIGETVIGSGTKIDNLVQIAHNVRIGAGSIIVAQVGIAGSATIGERVVIGGQSGINGHIKIGTGAQIGTRTGVIKSLDSGDAHLGFPSMPRGDWLRSQSIFAKLPELKKRLRELEERVKSIEGAKDN
jgi:UDP-3-O-[3-hydroxymyristoyl] glucosamine N-acyltransferase